LVLLLCLLRIMLCVCCCPAAPQAADEKQPNQVKAGAVSWSRQVHAHVL